MPPPKASSGIMVVSLTTPIQILNPRHGLRITCLRLIVFDTRYHHVPMAANYKGERKVLIAKWTCWALESLVLLSLLSFWCFQMAAHYKGERKVLIAKWTCWALESLVLLSLLAFWCFQMAAHYKGERKVLIAKWTCWGLESLVLLSLLAFWCFQMAAHYKGERKVLIAKWTYWALESLVLLSLLAFWCFQMAPHNRWDRKGLIAKWNFWGPKVPFWYHHLLSDALRWRLATHVKEKTLGLPESPVLSSPLDSGWKNIFMSREN